MMGLRNGEVLDEPLEAQFPLGGFESSEYAPQRFRLCPGDRVFVVSDGVFDAAAATGRYGDSALHRFVRRTGSLEPLQAVRSLLGDLRTYLGTDLDDDAVDVCVDWTPSPRPD